MDPEAQIESFIAKFSDDVAVQIRTARAHMRRRLPGAVELIYDNYNALAIGYGGNEKVGGIVFSICAQLGIPVRFIGTGEKASDIAPFDSRRFVESLFGE